MTRAAAAAAAGGGDAWLVVVLRVLDLLRRSRLEGAVRRSSRRGSSVAAVYHMWEKSVISKIDHCVKGILLVYSLCDVGVESSTTRTKKNFIKKTLSPAKYISCS